MSDPQTPASVLTILMTAPDAGEGERIVSALLDEGLIACGNLVPGVVSLYRWEGEVRRDDEVLAIMKTVAGHVPRLLARAIELHPYDVPELLVQPVVDGNRAYLDWVEKECR
jgi:periplasmic divalent cation tolerance protein